MKGGAFIAEKRHFPLARDEMTDAQFNARMTAGYAQARQDQSAPAEEVFRRLFEEIAE